MARITTIALIISLFFVILQNSRFEKKFIAENIPLLDITPLAIVDLKGTHVKTYLSIINYSGFEAKYIYIDMIYRKSKLKESQPEQWVGEWGKAETNRKRKIEERKSKVKNNKNQIYWSLIGKMVKDINFIESLPPGEAIELVKDHEIKNLSGSLNLDRVAESGKIPVYFKIQWKNRYRRVFEKIYRYDLVATIADPKNGEPESGRSFTFIPKSVTSKTALNAFD